MRLNDEVNKFVKRRYEKTKKDIINPKSLEDIDDLIKYRDFLVFKGYHNEYWETYTRTKYFLKNKIINNYINESIDKKEKEKAFYDWLKICINPQENIDYDFCFKKCKKNKEKQVTDILFKDYEKGVLRNIFKTPEWQIRLRKIRTWFLKRYDRKTAKKIHKNLIEKSWLESLELAPLRLICSILIGFIPLIFDSETWTLPLKLNWLVIIPSVLILTALVLIYFMYDCFIAIGGEIDTKNIIKRVFSTFLWGLIFSFIFSIIIYIILSRNFINFEKAIYKDFIPLRIIALFAVVALFIGILVQTIWEEKAVTEPL